MKYLLDTNIIAYLLKGNLQIEEKITVVGFDSVCISFINLCELYFGAYKSQKLERNLKNIEFLLTKIKVIHSNSSTAEIFGKLKAKCFETGRIIDGADLIIASFALDYGLILVTNNVKHFTGIETLQIENWI